MVQWFAQGHKKKATFDIAPNNPNALWNISNQDSLKSAEASYGEKNKTKTPHVTRRSLVQIHSVRRRGSDR